MSSGLAFQQGAHVLRLGVASIFAAVAGQSAAAQELVAAPPIAPIPVEAGQWLVPEDPARAADLQRLRAAAGSTGPRGTSREAEANWTLGLLALHGVAMPQDPVQAASRFQRAYQLGYKLAAAGLAWCAMDGCVGVPEPSAARQWIARLRASHPARALYLEWMVDQRLSGLQVAAPSSQRAAQPARIELHKLERAAQAGDNQALVELGIVKAEQGELEPALADFRAAASASAAAAANVALVTDRLKAKPEPQGEPDAQQLFEQARRLHRGDGVPVNYAEAIALYRRAADKGSEPARRMLQMILMGRSADGQISIPWMAQLAQVDVSKSSGGAVLPPRPSPALQRDPTPLYDLLPARWRTGGAAR